MSGSVVAAVPRAARDLLQSDGARAAGRLTSVGRVLRSLQDTAQKCDVQPPRLVAVSKTHAVDKISWAYQQGLRHFGENYVKELCDKSNALKRCGLDAGEVKWHFIGNIQRNKIKVLLECPGLWMVETLCKVSTAEALNRCHGLRSSGCPLKVMVQVNNIDKESAGKLGCHPQKLGDLVQYLLEDCPHLSLCGLMTVGRLDSTFTTSDPNPDFARLVQCKDMITGAYQFPAPLELSMGMSADYEHAIAMGSTSVRVGTAIFGPRGEISR